MPRPMFPDELKLVLREGLMCFPVSDFGDDGRFAPTPFVERLEWLLGFGPNVVVAGGGAGEFFSLTAMEVAEVTASVVDGTGRRLPVIASAGLGTNSAIAFAEEAEKLGADGLLLLPPYLTESPQDGLVAHIDAVCRATRLGIIVYNRANCVLSATSIARLADGNANFIAVKDGNGDVEELLRIQSALGERITLINGMPTAEVYAQAYAGMGIPSYSSAIFNFLPRSAMEFHAAVAARDGESIAAFVRDFLVPYCQIRRRRAGYAVSIIKAGLDIVGRSAGPVRPPLADLTKEERTMLAALIERAGPQD